MYSRAKYTRSSSKNISSENYNSKTLRTLDCQKTVYNNDQYAKSMSVDSSVRTGRRVYNTIINNVNNSRKTLPINSYIELSLDTIYEYLPPNSIVGYISVVNVNHFYEFTCDSKYFYIIDNILYSKTTFIFNKQNTYILTIFATKCIGGKTCETINRTFKISILDSSYIQSILDVCDIPYKKNNDLLYYLSPNERDKIKILKSIDWNNYYDDKIIKKNYIVDTSFINEHEQNYDIIIQTQYIDKNQNLQVLKSIFNKRILNTIVIEGKLIEGEQLLALVNDDSNNKYNKYNQYYWWSFDRNNINTPYSIINRVNSTYYTLTHENVDKFIFASLIYRSDNTIVLKNVSNMIGPIKNIDNLPVGNVNILGTTNIGYELKVFDNISDLDGITKKTITWYKSKKNLGNVTNAIFNWEISKDKNNWTSIEYSDNKEFDIPNDKTYINNYLRVKAKVYDVYGNSTLFISNISNVINELEVEQKTYLYSLTGIAKIGETLNIEYNNKDFSQFEDKSTSEIKYYWYRSTDKVEWIEISTNTIQSFFTIPVSQEQLYINKYIKVIVTVEKNNKITKYETNISDIIENYDKFTHGTATVSGKSSEQSILTLMLNLDDSIDLNDYIVQYVWEFTSDKIIWNSISTDKTYSLEEKDKKLKYVRTEENDNFVVSMDNKSMIIPSNGSFINKYIRCKILFEKDGIIEYLTSNTTSKIQNTDQKASGDLIIEGNPNFGLTVEAKFKNLMDPDGFIVTISYQWQYSETENSTNWINIGVNNSFLVIPSDDDSLINKELRVVATTIDKLGGITQIYSSNSLFITNYENTESLDYSVIITGSPIEGNTLKLLINESINKDKIIDYKWKYSYDKINFYTIVNQNNIDDDTLVIPDDNTYIGKYIMVEILYHYNNNEIRLYKSQITSRISYLNHNTKGTLLIQGVTLLGQKMIALFDGLFDEDNIIVDDFNMPFRNDTLFLDETTKDFRFKVSISYIDKKGTYNSILSEYTNYITDELEEFEIPDQPCYYVSTEILETDFYEKINDCNSVIIGLGASLILTENFILKGGQYLLIDGGSLTILNCNFEILNFATFIVQNNGELNLYGNLIVNDKAIYESSDDIFVNIEDKVASEDTNKKCNVDYKMSESMFKTLLNNCDKINIISNGHIILGETFHISNNKTIIVNKDGILQILNCNLFIDDTSTLIVYGLLHLSGTLTISENANFIIDNYGSFISDSINVNQIVIEEKITIAQLYTYFENNFQIIIGKNGIIDDSNSELVISDLNSLIISKEGKIKFKDVKIHVLEGGIFQINGIFDLVGGELTCENTSTIIFSEDSEVSITF